MNSDNYGEQQDGPTSKEKAQRLLKKWTKSELLAYCLFKASAAQIDAWAAEYDAAN